MACNSSSIFGCAIENFPLIIAGLALVAVILVLFRLALALRDRGRTPVSSPPPTENPSNRPRVVGPGQPLQPSPAPPTPPPPKPTPLQLKIQDAPKLTLESFRRDAEAQGDFGELLTALKLAADGWKQLPSKMLGGRGIDGLFVRELRDGGGFEALAAATKTNSEPYQPASMSDAKLAADIGELGAGDAIAKPIADELVRALRQGPSFFRKELWRHDLASGLSTITELGRDGAKGRSVTRSSARLMSALYLSLTQFDRNAVYVGSQPIDQSDI
ncbi:MAG: hypothetical protein K8S25_17560 [Alphaproteobacteria bacterium]|nr:hypothetical protein [Alphaproteobacteria bacterium]